VLRDGHAYYLPKRHRPDRQNGKSIDMRCEFRSVIRTAGVAAQELRSFRLWPESSGEIETEANGRIAKRAKADWCVPFRNMNSVALIAMTCIDRTSSPSDNGVLAGLPNSENRKHAKFRFAECTYLIIFEALAVFQAIQAASRFGAVKPGRRQLRMP